MKKLVLFILLIGLFGACKKKKNSESDATPVPAPVTPPSAPALIIRIPSDADGVLMASRIPYEFSNNYVTLLGNASAFFYTAPGNYNYLDAGTVTCNDSILVKQSSNAYTYNGKAINGHPQSGINYAAGSTWTIAGTSSVPSFTFSNSVFPSDAALTSSTLIPKSGSYTCTFSSPANADSVVVLIGCDSVLQKKTVSAASGSCGFTAAEVAGMKKAGSTNFAYINLISYRIQPNAVLSKKYYMVNSTTVSYRANIY